MNFTRNLELDLKNDVEVGGKKYLLSTVELPVWLGYKYETMLFAYDGENVNYLDLYCERYATKEEATNRHKHLLEKLKAGVKIWK